MFNNLPPKKVEFEIELLEQALERYEAEYKELAELWRNLDTKAQITLSTSGVFVSASGVLVKEVGSTFPPYMNLFLATAIILLALSVLCSVTVLVGHPARTPPTGKGYMQLTSDLIEAVENEDENEIANLKANLIRDKIRIWHSSVESRKEGCKLKDQKLRIAQSLLVLALIFVAVATVSAIFWRHF